MTRLKDQEAGGARLDADLADAPDRTVVRLPVNYEAVYAKAVETLEHHLASAEAGPARTAIRQLVEAVVVHAGDARGGKVRRLEIRGDLYRMLEFAEVAASGGERRTQNTQKPQAGGPWAFVRDTVGCGDRI